MGLLRCCDEMRIPDMILDHHSVSDRTVREGATLTMDEQIYDRLQQCLAEGGAPAVLQELATAFEAHERYHELFEVRKMQVRHRLGLPLLYTDTGDDLPDEQREALEQGLIDACREVGLRLLKAGKLREAWHYLRAVNATSDVQSALRQLEATPENVDEFIELCVHESLDLERGFQLMLESYGTCNSITTFDSVMYGRPREQRAVGARQLVEHLYDELRENVAAHIEREEGHPPAQEESLSAWIADRPWLFAEGGYHVDTTHLSSVVGFARDIDDRPHLELAVELARYGHQLHESLQYDGEPPFQPLYATSLRYFAALLGDERETQLDFFRERAEATNAREETTLAIEVYVDLLARIGEARLALREALRLLPQDIQQTGRAPTLMELAAAADDFEPVETLSRERQDPLGFALGLLRARS